MNGSIAQPDISNIWHVDKCVSRNLKLSVKSGSAVQAGCQVGADPASLGQLVEYDGVSV